MNKETMVLSKDQMKDVLKQFRKQAKEGLCNVHTEGRFGQGHWIKITTNNNKEILTAMVNNAKDQLYITRVMKGVLTPK